MWEMYSMAVGISILSRFCNVRLQHPHYVLCFSNRTFGRTLRAADHARTIARLRHADFPSSFNSVISRRRRQRSKACKGTRSSLTRMPICGAWSEDGRRHFPFSSTYFSTFCSSIWVRSFLNNDGKKREEPNSPPTDEPL